MKYWIELYDHFVKNKINNHPLEIIVCEYICKYIDIKKYKTLLEIGTGYGFSSLFISMNSSIEKIDTLEKNVEFYNYAKQQTMTKKINYYNIDAFEFDVDKKFDLILIDGPKSNQIILFDKYCSFLNDKGTIFIDNIYMKRIRNKSDKNSLKLIKKIDEFLKYLLSLKKYFVEIIDLGDGIAKITRKD